MKRGRAGLVLCCASILILSIMVMLNRDSRRLLEDFGSIQSDEMDFTVTLSGDNPGIIVTRRLSGFDIGAIEYGTTASISPVSWENQKGFFAFIDDSGRCWAYDGESRTWVYERLPNGGGRSWDIQTFPREIPPEVAARLPDGLAKDDTRR